MQTVVSNVTPLASSKSKKSEKSERALEKKRAALVAHQAYLNKWRKRFAIGLEVMAQVSMTVSLSHMAYGAAAITHDAPWRCWAVGILIEAIYLLSAGAHFVTNKELTASIGRVQAWMTYGTLAGSAAMNSFVYCAHADSLWFLPAAVIMGCAIPLLTLGASRQALALWQAANQQ